MELYEDELKENWKKLQGGRSTGSVEQLRSSHEACNPSSYRSADHRQVHALRFSDGAQQKSDVQPVTAGDVNGPLLDGPLSNQVQLDTDKLQMIYTLVWQSGANFDIATWHDWYTYGNDFRERARQWSTATGARGSAGA